MGDPGVTLYHDESDAMDLADFVKARKNEQKKQTGTKLEIDQETHVVNTKRKNKHSSHSERREKKQKFKMSRADDDFAAAEEYEDMMDDIVNMVTQSGENEIVDE